MTPKFFADAELDAMAVVQIACFQVHVQVVEQVDDDDLEASYDDEQHLILIKKQSLQNMREALMHELLHVCAYVSGARHMIEHPTGRDDLEEDIVRAMSPLVVQAMMRFM